MEKEQVIEELKALKEAFEEERDAHPICLEEAILLLEQQDGGDMISRKAAVDAVIKRDANCGIDSAEVLMSLPSIVPTLEQIVKYCNRLGVTIITNDLYHDLITAYSAQPETHEKS